MTEMMFPLIFCPTSKVYYKEAIKMNLRSELSFGLTVRRQKKKRVLNSDSLAQIHFPENLKPSKFKLSHYITGS